MKMWKHGTDALVGARGGGGALRAGRRLAVTMPLVLALSYLHAAALAAPSGTDVVARVRKAVSGIKDYTVDIDIQVDMPNVKMPDLSVRVLHKQPDKTKMVPLKGFAIVPKGALPVGDPFAGLAERAQVTVTGTERVAGRPAYRLKLVPKEETRRGALEAWVDRERWTVVRLRSESPTGEPVTVDITYQRVQGKYWLPARSVARLKFPADMGQPGPMHDPTDPDDAAGSAQAPAGPPKPGTVTVTFRAYKINTGLADSLFDKKSEQEAPRRRRWRTHGRHG